MGETGKSAEPPSLMKAILGLRAECHGGPEEASHSLESQGQLPGS